MANNNPSSNMKQVWAVEVDLLQQLLDVCRKHHLRVWVADGTLLGAVRHKGFIPWDNDIDVVMLREDYDRLLALPADTFRQPYFLQTPYTDKRYYHAHAQLRNSDTAAIRPSDSHRPFNQGIFIDIFPLDAVSEDEEQRRHVMRRVRKVTRFLHAYDTPILLSGRIGLLFRKWKCRWQVWRKGWQTIYSEVDDMLRAADIRQCPYVAEICFSGYDFLLDKHIFDDTVMLPFENIEVPAPKDYDAFLRAVYGDSY
ncbi:MAG: LicD family protein, partial [Prevotella sp.]|nr:LicD family protein [Prevotella sp.]